MNLVALFDPDANVNQQARVTLSFARGRASRLMLLVPLRQIEVSRAKAQAQIRGVVSQAEGFHFVDSDTTAAAAVATPADALPASIPVQCLFVDPTMTTQEHLAIVEESITADLAVVFLNRCDPRDVRLQRIGRDLVPRLTCAIAVVRLVDEMPAEFRRAVVPAADVASARGALQLARHLAPGPKAVEAIFVEPPIGRDAESVGHNALRHVLQAALGDDYGAVASRVVVADEPEDGVVRGVADAAADVLVVGASWPNVLDSRFHGTLAGRLCRRLTDVPVVVLRDALPAGRRLRRRLELLLQRFVPQLDRTTRLDLTQRVQSSSAWDFDFVALIAFSTVIAAMGLVQSSAAVVIGAMLVAPLMTPIMGLGLAIVQGNTMLARLALRTIGYGVGTAFVLATLVGFGNGSFELSSEMLARGWPGLLDLFVAFVSGLAAAYASSRPGLLAALPGVAIAAALVPPIATSGLAASRGEIALAYGSFLLFFTNMVAIVLAAAFTLWAVGVRSSKGEVKWLRWLGNLLVVLSIAIAVHLNQREHVGGVMPLRATHHAAVAARLPAGIRLVDMQAVERGDHVEVTVRLGAGAAPAAALADELAAALAPLFERFVRLRLVHEWEAEASARPVR